MYGILRPSCFWNTRTVSLLLSHCKGVGFTLSEKVMMYLIHGRKQCIFRLMGRPKGTPAPSGAYKPGQSGNPKGKPPGAKNYSTLAREAIVKIARTQNMKPEEFERLIYESGITRALRDFRYWNSHMDRVHGRPAQALDLTTGGEQMQGVVVLPPMKDD